MEDLQVLKFEKTQIPQPWENLFTNDKSFVYYGVDNNYPNYLIYLYSESPIHASIINAKSTYIIGDGLKSQDGKKLDFKVNAQDGINEFISKITKDYLIFNAFAVEVVYNLFAEPIEYHFIPAQHIRTNKSKTKFWYAEDWTYVGRKNILYDRWTQKNNTSTSKIFYFDGYFPSINRVYPSPEYNGSIKNIVTDIAIRDFNLNNIKNHFSVSSIITFFQNGTVPEDVKREMIKNISESHTGENGKKVIVDFQTAQGKEAQVKQLGVNDWVDAYNALREATSDDIFKGHQVVSPSLFGVKTAGQLGGSQELEVAYNIFKKNYVSGKRAELETALNMLFSGFKLVAGKVEFVDQQLFNQISDVTREKIMTIDELRKDAGLPALPTGGDRLLGEVPRVSESVKSPESPIIDSGAAPGQPTQPTTPVADVKKNTSRKLTEEDYQKISHLGSLFEDFEVIEDGFNLKFSKSEDVADYVLKHDVKGLTLEQLNDLLTKEAGLNETTDGLKDILQDLNDSGIVKVEYDTSDRVKITPPNAAKVPDSGGVTVLYQYIKRPDVDGDDLLPTSRSFCVKLIENNRLYTRAEIQTMGSIFEYDVYRYAGGFYHNPDNDETTPWCRHTWKQVKVKARKKD